MHHNLTCRVYNHHNDSVLETSQLSIQSKDSQQQCISHMNGNCDENANNTSNDTINKHELYAMLSDCIDTIVNNKMTNFETCLQ